MDFDPSKIATGIMKAGDSIGGLSKDIDENSIYHHLRNFTDRELAEKLADDVILCLNMRKDFRFPHSLPTIDDIHRITIDVLKDRGFESVASSYSIFTHGKYALHEGWISKNQFAGNGFPKKIISERKKWCKKHGVESIEKINEQIKAGNFSKLVDLDTKRFEAEIHQAGQLLDEALKQRKIRVMIISGPSSSGKTTTCHKLSEHLNQIGYKVKVLGVDNYYFTRQEQPRDSRGDMQCEWPDSIDLERLNQDLEKIIQGEEIYEMEYDFVSGSRRRSQKTFSLAKDEILLLDCLHGLFPPTTQSIPEKVKFKIYIETYPGICIEGDEYIKFTDIRLLRRMCRDARERGYQMSYTLKHWATVREGDFTGIVPFSRSAHARINSGLIYDVPALKYCIRSTGDKTLHPENIEKYREEGYMDAYKRASRVRKLMDLFLEPSEEEMRNIPKENVIREFIGINFPE